jgi:hypothetical protein
MLILLALVCLTAASGVVWRIIRRRRRQALGELAREWNMHYTARDVFGLAPHVATRLPIVGAADVRVSDLIYGSDQAGLQYIFCAQYTAGVIRSKSRRRCVVCVLEPKTGKGQIDWATLRVAPANLPLVAQYRSLREPISSDPPE